MKAAELDHKRKPDHLYTCDLLPPGRAYWWRADTPGENPVCTYVRADGTSEPFAWDYGADNAYSRRADWQEIGPMPRIDGEPDFVALAGLLA